MPLFENYIIKYPNFVPGINHPIAKHCDFCPQTKTMESYTNTLKCTAPILTTDHSNQNIRHFNNPQKLTAHTNLTSQLIPANSPLCHLAPAPNCKTTNQNTTEHTQTATTSKTTTPSNTAPTTPTIDIAALQQTILQHIKNDINQHINTQIQQKMALLQNKLMIIKRDLAWNRIPLTTK